MKIHELNRSRALDNLNLKLSALKDAIECPERTLTEYFPNTVRQFNHWNSTQNSDEFRKNHSLLKKNANSTLNKHPEIKTELVTILSAIVLARRNLQINSKPEKISKLKSDILELKKYILLLETYTANQKIEILRAREHFENETNKLHGAISELKRALKSDN